MTRHEWWTMLMIDDHSGRCHDEMLSVTVNMLVIMNGG